MPAQPSALSWLVFNDSDIEVARRLIDDLETSDATLDTLGFGRILRSPIHPAVSPLG